MRTQVIIPPIQRRIVCAAIRKGELIICGPRHLDGVMRGVISNLGESYTGWEQGFVDQFGKFWTRAEARAIAETAGQIRRECGPTNELYSESLY